LGIAGEESLSIFAAALKGNGYVPGILEQGSLKKGE